MTVSREKRDRAVLSHVSAPSIHKVVTSPESVPLTPRSLSVFLRMTQTFVSLWGT